MKTRQMPNSSITVRDGKILFIKFSGSKVVANVAISEDELKVMAALLREDKNNG